MSIPADIPTVTELQCPVCKTQTGLKFIEDVCIGRRVAGFRDDGVLEIHGHYDVYDEGSHDGRFCCDECHEEFLYQPFEEGTVEVDWV